MSGGRRGCGVLGALKGAVNLVPLASRHATVHDLDGPPLAQFSGESVQRSV